jgi:non-ribosomal peptide synthetase component E (peptide arylation enzyme)
MRTDASGWVTRLTDEDIVRYARTGAWRNVTLAECAIRAAEHAPDRIAVVDGEPLADLRWLLAEARQLTAAFSAMGYEPAT